MATSPVASPVIHRRASDLIKPRAKALTVPFSTDRLHMIPRDEAAVGAFAMLDRVQDEMPELAVASISLLFAAICQRMSVDPHDMHTLGARMLETQPGHKKANAQIEALDDLAKQQWQGREV